MKLPFYPTKSFRCAIYTRVSTDPLEQDFNSLDAQPHRLTSAVRPMPAGP
jgi:hypothetical protein